jgi:hypothetical protein
MHLPDPAYFSFGGAIVSLATAITGLVTTILSKKRESPTVQSPHDLPFLKNSKY